MSIVPLFSSDAILSARSSTYNPRDERPFTIIRSLNFTIISYHLPHLSPKIAIFLKKPLHFQKIYDNCLFCRYAVQNAETLDEISWFRFAVILSSLKDGYELFDYYSRPHPDYCQEKARAKFNNAKKYTVSCKTIANDFQGCRNCQCNI